MRQAIMTSPGVIEYRNVPDLAHPNDKEVLIQIKKIGVCGSDIHVYNGKHPATPYPVIQGHEYSGIVMEVGRKVKNVVPGMKVTARPQLVCGLCAPCKRGYYNICENLKVQGFQSAGVAQDLFIVPQDRVVVLADNLSLDQGAMIEPCAVGAHSTSLVSSLDGKNVVVSGAGPIGNLVAQFAKARGANKVLVSDISDYRLDIARDCGIEEVVNVSRESFKDIVNSYFGVEGFQVGFEAAGVQSSIEALMEYIEKGSEIVVLGVYAVNPQINMFYLGEHELRLFGSMMYLHQDYLDAVEAISSGKINLDPLITNYFPFEEYLDAYRFIERQKDKYMKVIIDM